MRVEERQYVPDPDGQGESEPQRSRHVPTNGWLGFLQRVRPYLWHVLVVTFVVAEFIANLHTSVEVIVQLVKLAITIISQFLTHPR